MMKSIVIYFAITCSIVWAQLLTTGDLREATVEDCLYNSPGFFFCTPADDGSTAEATNSTGAALGTCCPPGSVDNRCIDSGNPLEGIQCSMIIPAASNLTGADIGLFKTYEVDVQDGRATLCSPDYFITPTAEVQSLSLERDELVTDGNTTVALNTACYWVIQPEKYTWKPEYSTLHLTVTNLTSANLFVYTGTDRRNATTLVENGENLSLGAPLSLNVTDDIIIVLERTSTESSSFTMEYKIIGE